MFHSLILLVSIGVLARVLALKAIVLGLSGQRLHISTREKYDEKVMTYLFPLATLVSRIAGEETSRYVHFCFSSLTHESYGLAR